jgi:hypothetical protein
MQIDEDGYWRPLPGVYNHKQERELWRIKLQKAPLAPVESVSARLSELS